MSQAIVDLFMYNSGQDLTKKINAGLSLDSDTLQRQKTCLRNLFLVGAVDNREAQSRRRRRRRLRLCLHMPTLL